MEIPCRFFMIQLKEGYKRISRAYNMEWQTLYIIEETGEYFGSKAQKTP